MHNVGTLRASSGARLGEALLGIETPTLLGLHAGAPYFHNGSAATLADVFRVAGGMQVQAEDAQLGGGAVAEDVAWSPMKEWHAGQFVALYEARTITISAIPGGIGGAGQVTLRHNVAYSFAELTLSVNGNPQSAMLAMSPNVPSWIPNEWRETTIPVNFAAGDNTLTLSRGAGGGGYVLIDDITISTPLDLALASAHVRGLGPDDTQDLLAYLQSLDGSDAAKPSVRVSRAAILPQDATDNVTVPLDTTESLLQYEISNLGIAPLDLGQFRIISNPPHAAQTLTHPAPQILPGESTTLSLQVQLTSLETSLSIESWTNSPGRESLRWTVSILTGETEGEGEGTTEGEGENNATQTADQNGNLQIDLSELLRVIQLFNSGGLHCAENPGDSEDGYLPGAGANHTCTPHNTDYNPQDWLINLSELLRAIQIYNAGAYHPCPGEGTEDGFCPGLA